jgi:hypothetical protein
MVSRVAKPQCGQVRTELRIIAAIAAHLCVEEGNPASMVICYAMEQRSTLFILGFAVASVLGSIYGFLQGAWPFGVVEAIWAVIALRRWTQRSA